MYDIQEKLRLTRLLGLGIRDVRALQIGNLGWMNGWYPPYGDGSWMNGGLEQYLYKLCKEQKVPFIEDSSNRGYHWYGAPYPWNVYFGVDSS